MRRLFILICLLSLVGCRPTEAQDSAPPGEESETIVLGFSQLGAESAWRTGNTTSIQEAAERSGVQLMYKNAQQKQENQIKALRSFISYQVDVIVFTPIVEDGWDNVLAEAKEAGIPVLLCDRYVNVEDESLFAGFIGSDFAEEGRRAAQFLIDRMKDVPGTIRIVEFSGTEGSSPMRGRAEGFREVLSTEPRFQIIKSVTGDFLRSKGKENMRALLNSDTDFDVLYSHNDSMTLGAIDVMEEEGVRPGQDIIIISVDGEQAAIDALKQGKINCVVECTPEMGDSVMALVEQLAAGLPIPRSTYNEERVFTEFDDLTTLPPRSY